MEGLVISANTNLLLALAIISIATVSLAFADIPDIPSIVKQAMPCVVLIKTYDSLGNEFNQGNGFIISKDGDVITCYSVMNGYSKAVVTTSDKKEYLVQNITAINKSNDLVRLSVNATEHDFNCLKLNTTTPEIGQEIIVIGKPSGLGNAVSPYIVSAMGDNKTQIALPITLESSGSPILNVKGEVIGLVSSQMKNGQHLYSTIPASLILTMQEPSIEQIKNLQQPYSQISGNESLVTPLWKNWGYLSQEEFMKENTIRPLSKAYLEECMSRYTLKDKYNEAIQCYDCILDINPSDAYAWNMKGYVLYHLTRYEEALFCFNKSIELQPSVKAFWQNKGSALLKLHRDSEAEEAFKKGDTKLWKTNVVLTG